MTNDHQENEEPILSEFEELDSIVQMYENELIHVSSFNKYIHKDIEKEETDDYESLSSLYPISTVNNQMQSYNDFNAISFNPTKWFVTDSITGKLRPPRQNEFLQLLLENSHYSSYISWIDEDQGLFKIHEPEKIASLWAKVKNRQTNGVMNYETFSRAIRHYYHTGLMIKTHKKHTFRFKLPLNCIS